ncbi:recombination directionality factor [Chitinimonas naiadis]
MIKGLAITPPVIGRISIGRVVERNGQRLPEKDDSFTLTTQVQGKDGWILHPLHQVLLEKAAKSSADQSGQTGQTGQANTKLRAIPIRLLFNSSDLNLRAEFSAFDRKTGRPLCVGDGEKAKRVNATGLEETSCPTPERCEFGVRAGCKLYGRLNVQIDGQQDELGSFIFRTTGYNSVRTLAARLRYFEAVSGGNTRHLPLLLKLRAKSTTQSHRAPVYYVDLTLRDGDSLQEAVCYAKAEAHDYREAGVDIAGLEQAALQLLQNGQFEDGEDEVPQLLEEFYPVTEGQSDGLAGSDYSPKQGVAAPEVSQPVRGPALDNGRSRVRAAPLTTKLGQESRSQQINAT